MPVCEGCGASYEDGYKFCPHCGRSKPEPQKIIVEHHVVGDERLTRKDVLKLINTGGTYSWENLDKPIFRANLSGTNLSGIDLSGLDLSGVSFRGADFTGANLNKVNLENALVSLSNFTNANLKEANLSNTNFIKSQLRNADLSGARIDGAIFREGDLTNAIFTDAYYISKSPEWGTSATKNQLSQVKKINKSFLDKLFGV